MKIAVLGGSFNPIHAGHMMLADDVCTSLGYDKVLFVPAFIPPHKQPKDSVSAEHRAKMVEIACSKDSRFELETCEIDRGGVSYTFDTICSLEKKYQSVLEGKIGLIMGRDLFSGFHLWHNAQLIAEKCTLILAERPYQKEDKKFSPSAKGEYAKLNSSEFFDIKSEPLFANAVILKNEAVSISSSNIRKRAADGSGIKYLVPDGVFEYIFENGLYAK